MSNRGYSGCQTEFEFAVVAVPSAIDALGCILVPPLLHDCCIWVAECNVCWLMAGCDDTQVLAQSDCVTVGLTACAQLIGKWASRPAHVTCRQCSGVP